MLYWSLTISIMSENLCLFINVTSVPLSELEFKPTASVIAISGVRTIDARLYELNEYADNSVSSESSDVDI